MTHFTHNALAALAAILLMAGSFASVVTVPPVTMAHAAPGPVLA